MAAWKQIIVTGSNQALSDVADALVRTGDTIVLNRGTGSDTLLTKALAWKDKTVAGDYTALSIVGGDIANDTINEIKIATENGTPTGMENNKVLTYDAILGYMDWLSVPASEVTVSSATLVGVATDVQAVFEEIDNAVALNTAKITNVPTDLSYERSATTVTVISSDGSNAILPQATNSEGSALAGVLSSTDKTKIDALGTLAPLSLVTEALLDIDNAPPGAGVNKVLTYLGSSTIMRWEDPDVTDTNLRTRLGALTTGITLGATDSTVAVKNMTITGDLTVTGTTISVNSENTEIMDTAIQLNVESSGAVYATSESAVIFGHGFSKASVGKVVHDGALFHFTDAANDTGFTPATSNSFLLGDHKAIKFLASYFVAQTVPAVAAGGMYYDGTDFFLCVD